MELIENFERNENPTCIRCGHSLDLVDASEMMYPDTEEEYVLPNYEYKCPHCGAYHTVSNLTSEEAEDYPAFKGEPISCASHGYDGFCPQCGNSIVWQSDFMRSEIWGDVDETVLDKYGCAEDDSLATYVMCPHCGAYIEIVDVKPSEYKNYPAYAEIETN